MHSLALSIIVPVLNEAQELMRNLEAFKALEDETTEVIFADGGSSDGTCEMLRESGMRVVSTSGGCRAIQMNFAAQKARGRTLLFLHVDTVLPENFKAIKLQLEQRDWGFFLVKLTHPGWRYKTVASGINLRSNVFHVATGDQGIFVRTSHFFSLGGYRELALMEDIELARRLRRGVQPFIIRDPVTTSSRRWESRGVIRTAVLMWCMQLAFKVGISAKRLKTWYA